MQQQEWIQPKVWFEPCWIKSKFDDQRKSYVEGNGNQPEESGKLGRRFYTQLEVKSPQIRK